MSTVSERKITSHVLIILIISMLIWSALIYALLETEVGKRVASGELLGKAVATVEHRDHNDRGVKYLRQGEYELAIQEFEESIRLRPDIVISYFNLGLVYARQKKYQEALGYFNEVVHLDKEYNNIYLMRATIYRRLKRYELALNDLNNAVLHNANNSEIYNLRGIVYRKLGEINLALEDYNKAISIDPDNAKIYFNRGNLYSKQKNLNLALSDYNSAIGIKPRYAKAITNRAKVYLKQKRYKEAIMELNSALTLNPNMPVPHNALAWLYSTADDKKLHDGKKAVEHAQRVCDLTKWKKMAAIDTLAAAYARNGQFAKAVEWQEKVLEKHNKQDKMRTRMLKRLELYRSGKAYIEQ